MIRAFTLIEVLVAAMLSLVVMLAVQALVVRSMQTSRALEQQQSIAAAKTLGLNILEDDLASLAAVREIRVQDQRLEFIGLNDLCLNADAVRRTVRIEYELSPDGSHPAQLVRHESALEDPKARHSVIVASGLAHWTVEIFDGQSWHSIWPTPTPRSAILVRVRLRRLEGQSMEREFRLVPMTWRTHHD